MVVGRPPTVLVSVFMVVYISGSLVSDTSLPARLVGRLLVLLLARLLGRLLARLVVLAARYTKNDLYIFYFTINTIGCFLHRIVVTLYTYKLIYYSVTLPFL